MYEVHSNFGSSMLETESDALNALFLLCAYHNIDLDYEKARKALRDSSYYENFPLSVIKGE